MNIKALFDTEKRDGLLEGAFKRIRAKKEGEYPFVFALTGPKEAILVLDWRNETTPEKLMKEARKERPRKLIAGKAKLNGKSLELQVAQKKGTVKAKDVREFLAKRGLPVRKATVLEGMSQPKAPGES